jgi:hypothetical protein
MRDKRAPDVPSRMQVSFCAQRGSRLGETTRHYRGTIARLRWYAHHEGFWSSRRRGVGVEAYHTCPACPLVGLALHAGLRYFEMRQGS